MSGDVDQIAAQWLARRASGFTGTQERDFERWLAADPRHAAVFAELQATWSLLDQARLPDSTSGAPDPDALAPRHRGKRSSSWWSVGATAAAIVVGCFGWWQLPTREQHLPHVFATSVGGIETVTLPDRSVVRLNTDSAIEVVFSTGERRVRLSRGEAHFTVVSQPARPFFVEAKGVTVRAVGTAFNVRLHAAIVEVLVTEGKVSVTDMVRVAPPADVPPATPPILVAGERVVVPVAEVHPTMPVAALVPAAEIDRVLAWRERRLEFVATPLSAIVAEFNRYHRVQLRIDDPQLAGRRFGGSFRADEPHTLVRLLETQFGLRSEKRGDVIILKPAP